MGSQASKISKMDDTYSVQVIKTLEEFQELSPTWNTLLCQSRSDTVFLTWEWLYAWASCFLNSRRRLFVLCVHRSDKLVGIAPWYIEFLRWGILTIREIRFLGSPETGSDYLDVIALKGQEKSIAEALYNFLFKSGHLYWDQLRLADIPSESLFLLYFMNQIDQDGKFAEIQRCAYLPSTSLPSNKELFFTMLSSNRREKYRQNMRRIKALGSVEHHIYTGTAINYGLDQFFCLYNDKSSYNGSKLHEFLIFFCAMNPKKQWVQTDLLSMDGCNICGLLHLRYGDNLAMLLVVVDKFFSRKISLGNLFIGMCLENAIANDMTCYDFLKGDEDYKFHWANQGRSSLTLFFGQRRLKYIISTLTRLIKYCIKAILR